MDSIDYSQMDPLITILILVVELIVLVMEIMVLWTMYTRAGQPGWASLVPIYNIIIMLKIAGRPAWWFLLLAVPIVNIIVWFMICMDLAVAFDRGNPLCCRFVFGSCCFLPDIGFWRAGLRWPGQALGYWLYHETILPRRRMVFFYFTQGTFFRYAFPQFAVVSQIGGSIW